MISFPSFTSLCFYEYTMGKCEKHSRRKHDRMCAFQVLFQKYHSSKEKLWKPIRVCCAYSETLSWGRGKVKINFIILHDELPPVQHPIDIHFKNIHILNKILVDKWKWMIEKSLCTSHIQYAASWNCQLAFRCKNPHASVLNAKAIRQSFSCSVYGRFSDNAQTCAAHNARWWRTETRNIYICSGFSLYGWTELHSC